MSIKNNKKIVIPFLFISFLMLSGCTNKVQEKVQEKINEKMIEGITGGQVKVDLNKDKTKIETNLGSSEVGENLGLPKDFPSDVYVVEGIIKASYKSIGNNGWNLSIETDKSVAEVKTIYEQKLKDAGWKIGLSLDAGGSVIIGAEKEKRNVSILISVNEENKKISISLSVSEK